MVYRPGMTAPRPCAKPSCNAAATASLSYRYDSQQVWLLGLSAEPEPAFHDLCGDHADLLTVPRHWERVDQRPGIAAAVALAADPAAGADDDDADEAAAVEELEVTAENRYADLTAELAELAATYAQPEELTATGDTAPGASGGGPTPLRLSIVGSVAAPGRAAPASSPHQGTGGSGATSSGPPSGTSSAPAGSMPRGPGASGAADTPGPPDADSDDAAPSPADGSEDEDTGNDAVVVSLRAVRATRADHDDADDGDDPDGAPSGGASA